MFVKKKLLDHCRAQLLENIQNLQEVMEEAQQSANDYGPPKDRYDAFRSQLLRKRDMFAQQLLKSKEQLTILDKINMDKPNEKVELGAVIITEYQKLFVSIGQGKIKLEGEDWYAISPGVPIYKAMEGKRAGEEFTFNGRTSKILTLY
jgi:hypothetical protein